MEQSVWVPLAGKDLDEAMDLLPWKALAEVAIDGERPVTELQLPPDPAAFDDPPRVLTRAEPTYPRSARTYDYEGTVQVAALAVSPLRRPGTARLLRGASRPRAGVRRVPEDPRAPPPGIPRGARIHGRRRPRRRGQRVRDRGVLHEPDLVL